jgi:multidrug transporter EmrE-like cation transporter
VYCSSRKELGTGHPSLLKARAQAYGGGIHSAMGKTTLALLLTFGFSLLGVLGDYFLKVASLAEKPFRTTAFYLGFAVYGSTAFGWLFAMRHLKLATISTVYSVCIILLLTTLGVSVFHERLSVTEVIGIGLALASLVLLIRFA